VGALRGTVMAVLIVSRLEVTGGLGGGNSTMSQRFPLFGKTAKAMDLTILPTLLARADEGTRFRRRSCLNRIGRRSQMISRRTMVLAFTAGTFFTGVLPVLAKSRHSNWIRMFDTDNDGTVDLAEAKKAASTLFDKLDRDHDGTLDQRELARRLTPKEFVAADPDHDGTLTKDEYLAVVEQRFTAADPDHDGTLDAKELSTKAGQALLRLLK